MNVLIFGMKSFDQQVLEGVEQADVDRWIATGTLIHGNYVRPMRNICVLQLNYEPEEKSA